MPSPTKTKASSSIKGGGRAAISEESQQLIISLLQSLRDENNPLLPKSSQSSSKEEERSDHEEKREQKRFVKKLVECHTRHLLKSELNSSETKISNGTDSSSRKGKSTKSMKPDNTKRDASARVRIQLAEALCSVRPKNKKAPFKEGKVRKTLVLSRFTSVSEILELAKPKLRMTNPPNRVFCIKDKMEIDLTCDLTGVADGDLVFVSSYQGSSDTKDTPESEEKKNADNKLPLQQQLDPLEAVKRAYANRNKTRSQHVKASIDKKDQNESTGESLCIKFSDCLEQLQPIPPSRAELPAAAFRKDILTALDNHRVLVISGETGCGKSTQVPQFLLEGLQAAGTVTKGTSIIVTQPRRVAAMSLAERVAHERSSPPPGKGNSEIGYLVRLARAVTPSTRIVYCTVGILLRMLVNQDSTDDCMLSKAHVLVVDEVHERDLNTDFLLTLLKILLRKDKHKFKVVLMSATTSPQLFVRYFSIPGIHPHVISIPGRTFPVKTQWLDDCERLASAQLQGWTDDITSDERSTVREKQNSAIEQELSPRATTRIDNLFICKLIGSILHQEQDGGNGDNNLRTSGSILVFLPGKGEIDALSRVLYQNPEIKEKCRILPLHSKAQPRDQRAVFQPAKEVKIVLATNVAETSVTIPDVSVVIDTGRVKEARWNSSTRIKELTTVFTSQASATQRAGRAGRTGPGVCYKLYTQNFVKKYMPKRTSPEMVRTPLDELVLQVCLLEEMQRDATRASFSSDSIGTSPVQFLRQAPEPPPDRQILHACKHLVEAGALALVTKEPDLLFRLTPLGFHLSHLPMDAKVGKVMIVGCILECVDPALTVAAALSCPKTCWLRDMGRPGTNDEARDRQKQIIRNGFGGALWKGGTVKGDIIAVIAAYNEWASHKKDKDRRKFARENALDHSCLCDMYSLRKQFRESLVDAGFLNDHAQWEGSCNDDALLTSCCLVAGLYPNIATLLRPNRAKRIRGGRLITKDGSSCRPSSSSFQAERIKNASESGKDAYSVFHSKHRNVGVAQNQVEECFLCEINFVSRFSVLLFGGEIEMKDNALVVDGWLKFKVGDKGQRIGAILIQELRKELDNVMLKHMAVAANERDVGSLKSECDQVMQVVRKLLVGE